MVVATFEGIQKTPDGVGSECAACLGVIVDFDRPPQAVMGDNILNYRPIDDQKGIWQAGTRLPFNPFVSSASLTDLDVECPKCERQVSTCKSSSEFGNSVGQVILYNFDPPPQRL